MLWTIFLILAILWIIASLTGYTLGGSVHIIIAVLVIILIVLLVNDRRRY